MNFVTSKYLGKWNQIFFEMILNVLSFYLSILKIFDYSCSLLKDFWEFIALLINPLMCMLIEDKQSLKSSQTRF